MDNNEFNENNLGNGQGQDNDLYGFNPDLNHNNYNNNSNYNNDSEGFNQNHNYNSGGFKQSRDYNNGYQNTQFPDNAGRNFKNYGMRNDDFYYKPSQKRKTRFWTGFFAGFIVAFVVIIAYSFAVYSNSRWPVKNDISSGAAKGQASGNDAAVNNNYELDMDKIGKKLAKIQKIIGKSYLFSEDPTAVEEGIYAGFMKGLGDPYSVYYTEDEYKKLTEDTSGVYQGIGASVSRNPNTGITSISKVFKGTPAQEAGLMSGDIIYKVNGEDVTGLDLDILVRQHIRGEDGSSFEMTVLRGDGAKEMTFTLTRRKIEVPTVESRMLEDKIGYISVSQFDELTSEQFKAAIEELKNQGMEGLVVDLRDNPGGLLSAVVDMLDYILPKGLLVYTADKDGNGQKYSSDDEHALNMPMVVVVNGNSASASEVFAGAVRDFDWAKLVGTKTFGKGIVQNLIPLSDGSAIKITTSHYYTPEGFDLHGKGIEPDIKVELDEGAQTGSENDNQLKTAVEALKEIAPKN